MTFSQSKEKERDVLRESKSLEGFRRKTPQVPPDEDLVCGSFLIISPQSSVSTFLIIQRNTIVNRVV